MSGMVSHTGPWKFNLMTIFSPSVRCLLGTVMDAYSKISISFSGAIVQTRPNNPNVSTVLGGHWVSGDVQIELPGQPRIIVKHTGKDAGKQGAVDGDVVTHINGKVVNTTNEFIRLIDSAKQRGESKIILAFNADRSVAEALKRRASVIAELW
jgi:S1-C subfamily serine protease